MALDVCMNKFSLIKHRKFAKKDSNNIGAQGSNKNLQGQIRKAIKKELLGSVQVLRLG